MKLKLLLYDLFVHSFEACEKAAELIRETLVNFNFPISPPSKELPVEHDNTSAITSSVAEEMENHAALGSSTKVILIRY